MRVGVVVVVQLLPLGGLSVGNHLETFHCGGAAYKSMWSAIRDAKQYVILETYTLGDDAIGERTVAELAVRFACAAVAAASPCALFSPLRFHRMHSKTLPFHIRRVRVAYAACGTERLSCAFGV